MKSKDQIKKYKQKSSSRDVDACQDQAHKKVSEAKALERILKSVKLSKQIDNIRKKGFIDENQGYMTQHTMNNNGVNIFDTKNMSNHQKNFLDLNLAKKMDLNFNKAPINYKDNFVKNRSRNHDKEKQTNNHKNFNSVRDSPRIDGYRQFSKSYDHNQSNRYDPEKVNASGYGYRKNDHQKKRDRKTSYSMNKTSLSTGKNVINGSNQYIFINDNPSSAKPKKNLQIPLFSSILKYRDTNNTKNLFSSNRDRSLSASIHKNEAQKMNTSKDLHKPFKEFQPKFFNSRKTNATIDYEGYINSKHRSNSSSKKPLSRGKTEHENLKNKDLTKLRKIHSSRVTNNNKSYGNHQNMGILKHSISLVNAFNKGENKGAYHSILNHHPSFSKKAKLIKAQVEASKKMSPQLNGFITQVPQGGNDMKLQSNSYNNTSADKIKTSKSDSVERINVRESLDNKRSPSKENDHRNSANCSKTNIYRQNSAEKVHSQNNKEYGYYYTQVLRHFKSKEDNYFANLFRDHFRHTYVSLQFCKNLKPPGKKDIILRKTCLSRKTSDLNKKSLVLDLDETLIHCNTTGSTNVDAVLPIKFPSGEQIEAPINLRPYAREFLKEMAEFFEIIIFTASHSCYANVVLDYIDPKNEWISHRLFRESCIQTETGVYIKDLRIIDRSMSEVVQVDNASYSFGFQIDSGIPIIPFYDSKEDIELISLAIYLKRLSIEGDVRPLNKKHFAFRSIVESKTPSEAYDRILVEKNNS